MTMKYNERLIDLMQKYKIDADALALALEIDREELADILDGVLTPTMDQLIDFADLFHCSIDFLVGRRGYDPPAIEAARIEHPPTVEPKSMIEQLYERLPKAYQARLVGYGLGLLKSCEI